MGKVKADQQVEEILECKDVPEKEQVSSIPEEVKADQQVEEFLENKDVPEKEQVSSIPEEMKTDQEVKDSAPLKVDSEKSVNDDEEDIDKDDMGHTIETGKESIATDFLDKETKENVVKVIKQEETDQKEGGEVQQDRKKSQEIEADSIAKPEIKE